MIMTPHLTDTAKTNTSLPKSAVPSNLQQLLDELEAYPDHLLIFRSEEGDIGAGFHVTELKQASIKSIDCGGRTDQWTETVLQLLDSSEGTPMAIGKFLAIAEKSEAVLPGLSGVPLIFEYAPGNRGLHRMKIASVHTDDQRVVVSLGEDRAVCKPLADWQNAMAGDCCAPATQQQKCC